MCSQAHLPAYCACAAAFVELLLAHYSDREVNVLLKDLNRHIAAAGAESGGALPAGVLTYLDRIMGAVVDGVTDFAAVLGNDHFMQLLDKFQSDKKNAVCKSLLRSFTKTSETTDDPVMIHTMPVGRESPNTHA